MGTTRSLGEGCRKDFSNKLLPRLSHRVCRLLSSPYPVLLRKLFILDVSFNTCGALKYTSRSGGGKMLVRRLGSN